MASPLRLLQARLDEFKSVDWDTYYDSLFELFGRFDPKVNTIFCDMDGVVADFDHYILAKMGRTFSHNEGPGADKPMWDFLASIPNLYYILPPTSYVKQLWDAVKDVGSNREMLTAIPRRATVPTAEKDKNEWMVLHRDLFGEEVNVRIGPYSRDKWKHAKRNDILIDDRLDNCVEWINAGGVAIWHDGDVERTIRLLKLYTK